MSRIAPLEPPYATDIQQQFDRIMRGAAPLMLFRVIAGHSIDNHNDAYRASLEHLQSRKDSLSATPGPFNAPTTEDVSKGDVPPSSSVGSKNAPGKAGEVGEKIMGGFGVGGTHVERPKEEQGLGEKIVNFLGA